MRSKAIATFLTIVSLTGSNLAYAQGIPILYYDPVQGPICAGPLGPGQCALVAQWIATHPGYGGIPVQTPAPVQFPLQQQGFPTPAPISGIPIMPVPGSAGIPVATVQASISATAVNGALECAQMTGQVQNPNVDRFLTCTRGALVLDKDSAVLVGCAEQAAGDKQRLATCAGSSLIGSKLSRDQKKALDCAKESSGDGDTFAGCIADGLVENNLNPQQKKVLNCAIDNDTGSSAFVGCTAKALYGDKLNPEARAAVDCAVQSDGDAQQFGACAANKFFHLNLNPEQQIAVQCVLASGGQPYAAAGCTASKLTLRELEKCSEGIGGDGCFGDNNDLVGKNGFVVRNLAGLAGGPNSVINDPGQILGGPESVFNHPAQVLGGPNSFPNQVLNNVPSPPPIEVGKIGNHKICIPWC